MVLFGGWDGHAPFGDTWTWNGARWERHDVDPAPPARMALGQMVFDPRLGALVLQGGTLDHGGPYLNDTWAWDGDAWRELATREPRPRGAYGRTLVFDRSRQRLLLMGGLVGQYKGGETLDEVWVR